MEANASTTAAITILAIAGVYFIGVTMESHSLTLDEA
ncbi:DNA-binding protein, partial [Salmonella enterica]|nr:DNA-binding protein [Salmonella enterica]